MEFREVVRRRRMVRNYADAEVDPAAVERILDTARRAPSAGFSQGHRFVVVTSTEGRRRIAELAHEPEYVAKGFEPWISRAAVHVVVCVDEGAYHRRYREPDKLDASGNEIDWPVPYWFVDAGAALMLLLQAAVDEGLAAGFAGSHSMDDLRAELQIPDGVHVIGVVTIGHPGTEHRAGSGARPRLPLADVVHHERWRA